MKRLTTIVALLLLAGRIAALGYVESSAGLNNPVLDGGRTELEFADINNDGNVDILSIGDHGNPYINTQEHGIMVWFGDGHGNWSVYQDGNFGYGGIAVGDINNDGKWDVACGMHHNYADPGQLGTKILEAALGDGTGRNWTAWDSGLATHGEDWGMFGTDFADIDNDGWLDLVSNSFGASAGVHVYRNYHDGTWDQCFGFTGGNSQEDAVFGDINNDGNADIAVGHQYGTVYFGDGAGNFTLAQHNLPSPGNRGHQGVALGDVDNDGAANLAFVRGADTIEVWKWNPAADSWVSLRGNLPLSGYEAVQLCDMNCDGYMDLVGYGSAIGTIWTGDGHGNWTQAAGFTTPTYGDFEALRCGGDVDRNGFPDIVLVDDEGSYPSDHNVAHCFRETSVAETLRIRPVFPRGGENFAAGSVQFIDWTCAVPSSETTLVRLEFSDGGPWSLIADNLENSSRYQWTVPNQPSSNCRIRYIVVTRGDADTVATPGPFTILPGTAVRTQPGTALLNPACLNVFPNPVRDRAVVSCQLTLPGPLRITLQDALGRSRAVAFTQEPGTENQELRTGQRYLTLDTRSLAPGVYFVRLSVSPSTRLRGKGWGEGLSTARFIKVR